MSSEPTPDGPRRRRAQALRQCRRASRRRRGRARRQGVLPESAPPARASPPFCAASTTLRRSTAAACLSMAAMSATYRARRQALRTWRPCPRGPARRDRHGVPALQSVSSSQCHRQHHQGAAAARPDGKVGGGGNRPPAARSGRAPGQGRKLSVRTLGWPAAARRHRSRPGNSGRS